MSQLMSRKETGHQPLPEAYRTLPPIPVQVLHLNLGLHYESWPHGRGDVIFGYNRKPIPLEVRRSDGRVLRLRPKRIPGYLVGEFFWTYRTPANVDGWLLRERFLAISTPQDALEFLRDTGPFLPPGRPEKFFPTGTDPGFRKSHQIEVTLSELQYTQAVIKRWLTHEDVGGVWWPEWLGEPKSHDLLLRRHLVGLTVGLSPSGAAIPTDYGLQAIWATILLDRGWGAKFRCCRREDCGRVFRVRDPRQVFCSYRCAHLVVVRKSRKRKKRARRSR